MTSEPPAAAVPRPGFLPPPATTGPRSVPALLSLVLRRPGGRRAGSVLVAVVVLAAIACFAVPAVTDVVGALRQGALRSQFDSPAVKAQFRHDAVPIGDGLTQLVVDNPRVHINVLVVQGTTPAALEAGAGHYVHTPLPCYRGNVAIAGHRTTYGRPFNRLDEMRPGDTATLVTPIGRCTYRVVPSFGGHANPWVVAPDDFGVVAQDAALGTGHWLTLTSCNPPGSAAQRIVLRLRLVASTVRPPQAPHRAS